MKWRKLVTSSLRDIRDSDGFLLENISTIEDWRDDHVPVGIDRMKHFSGKDRVLLLE